jgi:hypothetical protein
VTVRPCARAHRASAAWRSVSPPSSGSPDHRHADARYPALRARRQPTIVQPSARRAARRAGHAIFGECGPRLTASLARRGGSRTYIGARLALRARPGALRVAIATLLLASALKLWTLPNSVVLAAVLVSLLIAAAWSRWRHVVAMRDLAMVGVPVGAPPPLPMTPAQAPAQAPT